jgi:hypothetical protein
MFDDYCVSVILQFPAIRTDARVVDRREEFEAVQTWVSSLLAAVQLEEKKHIVQAQIQASGLRSVLQDHNVMHFAITTSMNSQQFRDLVTAVLDMFVGLHHRSDASHARS